MLNYLKKGLQKTKETFKNQFDSLFKKTEIDEDFFEELEEILIAADVGMETTIKLVSLLKERIKEQKIKNCSAAREVLRGLLTEIMEVEEGFSYSSLPHSPMVILVVGVNGVGKTTTIAKIAHRFRKEQKSVLLAAGDTFRAAAIEQLEEWSQRVRAGLIKHQLGGDSSAVIYDAVSAAIAREVDVVLCDTAGRLHTKSNLLQEVQKIYRVINKALEGAPHEILLVLDATTGQNGVVQAKYFQEFLPVSGIVLTKLDGTARGGIVIAVKDLTGIPVKMIGVGEKEEDLELFDAAKFAEALLS
ncbi:MAG: signal recognition particle-docking protein FtsY [Dethiobacteria bacterium]|jgi:fused signal recognition particle receptor